MFYMNYSLGNNTVNMAERNEGVPVKAFLSVTPCLLFFYINMMMLFTMRKRAIFMQTSRYILFGHMLCIDTLHLLLSMISYIFAIAHVYFVGYVCLIFVVFATVFTQVSPLNLALMSLERYVAVCLPLRHAVISTCRKTNMAIAVVWILGSVQSVYEVVVFCVMDSVSTSMQVFCSKANLFQLRENEDIRKGFTVIYFLSVTVVIVYTYFRVIIIAKSATSNNLSASKATETVLLHFIQLIFCLSSFLIEVIQNAAIKYTNRVTALNVQYVTFLTFIIFPKCLSPLIYGLRDRLFSSHFKFYLTFGLKGRVKTSTIAKCT